MGYMVVRALVLKNKGNLICLYVLFLKITFYYYMNFEVMFVFYSFLLSFGATTNM